MKIAVAAIIKNEHKYLKEWIDYNLSIGFTGIHLWEDVGSDSHFEITEPYGNQVCLHPYSEVDDYALPEYGGTCHQDRMISHFLAHYREEFDWVAFIDPDEFITFDQDWDLEKLISRVGSLNSGIYLRWIMYGASGRIEAPTEGTVFTNYPYRCYDELRHLTWKVKSLVNLKQAKKMLNNHIVQDGVTTLGVPSLVAVTSDRAKVNHYYTKSWEDWAWKICIRGDVFASNRRIDEFFYFNPDLKPRRDELISKYISQIPKSECFEGYICSHTLDFHESEFPLNPSFQVLLNNSSLEIPEDLNLNFPIHQVGTGVFDRLYSEVSAIIWMGKHPSDKKYTGLCHYRRYFRDYFSYLSDQSLQQIFDEEPDTVIVPSPVWMQNSNRTSYSEYHGLQDFDLLVEIIKDLYPDYAEITDQTITEKLYYPYCMFVMPTSKLPAYSEWLETILTEFVRRRGWTSDQDAYDYVASHLGSYHISGEEDPDRVEWLKKYQSRMIGFLVERLGIIYYRKNFKRILTKQITKIEKLGQRIV